ncbi:MAG: C40 family peptidase [Chromatiales bacterium]|nr:C40 family peptidase [Chromatiales bacterium]
MALQRGLLRLLAPLVAALAVGLTSCSSPPRAPDGAAGFPVPPPGIAQPADPVRSQVVFTAMQMVGVPYRWGGSTPQGFDCSGLVQYAYSNAGLRLPRTAADQMDATAPVTLENAQAGDLLFFRDGSRTSHVAIYLGEGRFVHAPSTGNQVSLDSFGNAYWRMRFARAGRITG